MNILVMGDCNSAFNRNYCIEVLKNDNVVILSKNESVNYNKDYDANGIRIIRWPEYMLNGPKSQYFNPVGYFRAISMLRKEIEFTSIDVFHVHYFEPIDLLLFYPLWRNSQKKNITFWGSDLLYASQMKRMLYPFFLKQATSVVMMVKRQKEYFNSIMGHRYDNKIRIIDFGNCLLNIISMNEKRISRNGAKKKFGIPVNKIILHVGYNASNSQQHLTIINEIVKLPPEYKKIIFIVFPIAYGKNENYLELFSQIKKLLDIAHISYALVDRFLQGEELAMFRRTCDIFVYGQDADARSASPLEYLYAGAKFVYPRWLADNYEFLPKCNKILFCYNTFENLHDSIHSCMDTMQNFSDVKAEFDEYNKIKTSISDEISWDNLAKKWRALYD